MPNFRTQPPRRFISFNQCFLSNAIKPTALAAKIDFIWDWFWKFWTDSRLTGLLSLQNYTSWLFMNTCSKTPPHSITFQSVYYLVLSQVWQHVCLSIPFIKGCSQKGQRKEHCMCIKENKTFHCKAFSATLQASTHLFDTCEYYVSSFNSTISTKNAVNSRKSISKSWLSKTC